METKIVLAMAIKGYGNPKLYNFTLNRSQLRFDKNFPKII